MSIPPETIDKIRLATDIVELIREYLPGIKRSGRNWKANCPFHHEKTPSFMVNGEKGIFHCFGCHAGGDAYKFVMMMDNLSWPEAVRKLGGRVGITVIESKEDIVKRSEKQKIYDLLEQAAKFYHRTLKESPEGNKARKYLAARGVTPESIEKFMLGYAPKGSLMSAAAKKGFSPEQLAAAGLVTKTERGRFFEYMSDRLVFPIVDAQGRVVAFGGRTLGDDQPKYLNTPETAVYSKSSHLYGLFQALPTLRQSRRATILEGYMDVVVTHQYGATDTVATLGTALTAQHAHILKRYVERLTLLFDPDSAGITAARRALDVLVDSELELRVANLPDGLDPDEFLIRDGKEAYDGFCANGSQSAIEFLVNQAVAAHGLASPEAKAKVAAEVIPFIEKSRNAVLRREWISYTADRLKTGEDAILAEMRRLKKPADRRASPGGTAGTGTPENRPSGKRTAEEEVLQILAAYPQCRRRVEIEFFTDARCRRVFEMMLKDVPVADVVNHLEEADRPWFTEMMLEEKSFSAPEHTLEQALKTVRLHELERRRQELEKEWILMMNGKIPRDEEKIEQFNALTRQLKGSVR